MDGIQGMGSSSNPPTMSGDYGKSPRKQAGDVDNDDDEVYG